LNAKTPGKPTGLHLSKYTADWVFFAWEPPEDSGGFPIDVHRLQFRPVEKSGSKRWVELNKKLKMPEIQVTSDVLVKHGIHGGVTYEFRCCSRTRRGWGEWSEPYRIECPGYRERLGGEQKSEVSLSKKAPPRRINSKTGTAALPKVIKKEDEVSSRTLLAPVRGSMKERYDAQLRDKVTEAQRLKDKDYERHRQMRNGGKEQKLPDWVIKQNVINGVTDE